MNTPFPPPPNNAQKPKRKLWPWFLGGCLLLVLVGGVLVAALFWFGIKAVGTQARDSIASLPAVQQNFGALADASFDTSALAQGMMAFSLRGELGEGRLAIRLDPETGAFDSATLTLPNGEVRELDGAALQRLQALQDGNWMKAMAPAPVAPVAPDAPPAPESPSPSQ